MREIALHLLDLAENSVSAGARKVEITVREDLRNDLLTACIKDDGRGMDPETIKKVTDPFYTSRKTRKVGLGIPLLKSAAEECCGSLTITSRPGDGAAVEVIFKHSHIDRMPLGNLPATFLNLLIGHPETHWVFRYEAIGPGDQALYEFDDELVKDTLDGISLTTPEILKYLRLHFEESIQETRAALQTRPGSSAPVAMNCE